MINHLKLQIALSWAVIMLSEVGGNVASANHDYLTCLASFASLCFGLVQIRIYTNEYIDEIFGVGTKKLPQARVIIRSR